MQKPADMNALGCLWWWKGEGQASATAYDYVGGKILADVPTIATSWQQEPAAAHTLRRVKKPEGEKELEVGSVGRVLV